MNRSFLPLQGILFGLLIAFVYPATAQPSNCILSGECIQDRGPFFKISPGDYRAQCRLLALKGYKVGVLVPSEVVTQGGLPINANFNCETRVEIPLCQDPYQSFVCVGMSKEEIIKEPPKGVPF